MYKILNYHLFKFFREDGWWYGQTLDGSGKKGFFPQNHVQLAKGLAKEIDPKDIEYIGLLGAGGYSVVRSAIYKGRVRIHSIHMNMFRVKVYYTFNENWKSKK